MKKLGYIFGILSPIFYLLAVVVGGVLWPEYSHLRQPISELTADFAPNMPIVDLLFWAANISGLLFGLLLLFGASKKNRIFKVTAILLVISGVVGIAFAFFPQDPIGAPLSFKGLMHFVLAGLASISTIAIVYTGAFAFSFLKNIKKFSLVMGTVIVLSGFLTVFATQNFGHIFGVFERITIFSYMAWLLTVSFALLNNEVEAKG